MLFSHTNNENILAKNVEYIIAVIEDVLINSQ